MIIDIEYTYFWTFLLTIEMVGVVLGPCEGMNILPLLLTTLTEWLTRTL